MPVSTERNPSWFTYANKLIDCLRHRHGVRQLPRKNDAEPSELDNLFQKLEGPEPGDTFTDAPYASSRQVPARQLLTVIRLAATIGSQDRERDCMRCGALTVINGIDVDDTQNLKEVATEVLPSRLAIFSPDILEGALSKSAQPRFERAIGEALDRIDPALILQADGVKPPKAVTASAPTVLTFAPVTGDVILKFIEAGHLSDHITDRGKLRDALCSDEVLAKLSTAEICAALRAPSLHQAIAQLSQLAQRDRRTDGPCLEDMTGDAPALEAARRIVSDLRAWSAGKAEWNELSHSLLFYGVPGTGKTFLAQAMANSSGISLVTGNFGTWQAAGHLGDMLREMRATFTEARRRAPCLLLIDEIDAVGSRFDTDRHGSNYRAQVITTFLTELDRIGSEEGVVVVGTCNEIDRIDPAVIRAGRMDVKIEVPLPDAEALLAILRYHLSEDIADHELRVLSRRALGKTAADIDAAIRAARSDARHQRKLLTTAMLKKQLHVDSAMENRDLTWRIAVHEAGHAVVATALGTGDVERISITEEGGKIWCRPRRHESRLSDLEAEVTYSLAGRAAERLLLDEISAGAGGPAHSDLAQATRQSIDIETRFGLGYEGPVWHSKPEAVYLATPQIRDKVRQRIIRAERHAGEILTRNQHHLEALARHLVEHRSMKAQAVARLLECVSSPPPKQPGQDISA
ncbi:AAA family ATPase [Marivita sp. GX14005]|uniref:AAA family ATPase n=1 Tax=Marivita sp. GX14005 TaxID=2942276 RepID=UPI0020195FDE|nr:AAA family ATPase [Marivita sp. GX14005]MCL3881915.1 AAA family ATPase [Marivita sp. GX14005]